MPFTIGGEWIPETSPKQPVKPVKVLKQKRRSSIVTVILHLPYDSAQLKMTCTELKKQIGCGGSVKNDCIELQGDQVEFVKQYLKEKRL